MLPSPPRDPTLALARSHVALGALLVLGRGIGATPALARGLAPYLAGQVLLAGAIALGVLALGAAALATVRSPRPRALVLGLACVLALARRSSFDVFDLVYLLSVLLFAVPAAFGSTARALPPAGASKGDAPSMPG